MDNQYQQTSTLLLELGTIQRKLLAKSIAKTRAALVRYSDRSKYSLISDTEMERKKEKKRKYLKKLLKRRDEG